MTRIEGLSIDELLVRLRKTSGGLDGYLRWNTVWLIEHAGLLYALGVAQTPDRLRFSLILRDRRHVEREMAFLPQASMPERLGQVRLWSGELTPDETKHRWGAAIRIANEPFYLQQGDEFFRIAPMAEIDGLYVQFRANSTADAEGLEISQFVTRVHDEVQKTQPKNLVLEPSVRYWR